MSVLFLIMICVKLSLSLSPYFILFILLYYSVLAVFSYVFISVLFL